MFPVIRTLPVVCTSNGNIVMSAEPSFIFSTLPSKKNSPCTRDGVAPPRLICKIEAIYDLGFL